ncbi:hypothetical protein D3C84_767240 [compost metagenome]
MQSIIASITGADYKWIVCEGSSDKIYLEHYFSDGGPKPFILPVGAAKNVKKIYNYLIMALENDRDDIAGRVLFLLDTDKDFEKFDSTDGIANLRIRRLLNSTVENKTTLVQTTSSTFYPPTEIEDCLDAEAFLNTLLAFEDNEDVQNLMDELTEPPTVRDPTLPSGLALNLRDTDKLVFERIFDLPGFKIQFALLYATQAISDDHPEWINEIRKFLYPPKARLKRRK